MILIIVLISFRGVLDVLDHLICHVY